jgi:hypothetical protein
MGMSTYGANAYAGVIVGLISPPSSLYLALLLVEPDVNDTGSTITEPAAADYERQLLSMGSGNWTPAVGGFTTYISGLSSSPVADWGDVVAYAICDSLTAGNMLMYGTIPTTAYDAGLTIDVMPNALRVGVV